MFELTPAQELASMKRVKAQREKDLAHKLLCNERAGQDNYTQDQIESVKSSIAYFEKRIKQITEEINDQARFDATRETD